MSAGQQREFLALGPKVSPHLHRAAICSSGAALTLIVWDALLTLVDEVDHIWSKPGRMHVKWLYLFSRWFGLMNQIGILLQYSLLTTYSPIPLSTCEALYIFEVVSFQLLQMCLNAVLILRIWAMHQRRRLWVIAAFVLILIEILMIITTQKIVIPDSVVDGSCLILHIPAITSFTGISMVATKTFLLYLTYRGKLLMQPAARRSKIITVVIRDGVIVFGVAIGTVLISLLYLVFNQHLVNVLFPWMPVVPALLTPRIILDLQMTAESAESILEFTTHLASMTSVDV